MEYLSANTARYLKYIGDTHPYYEILYDMLKRHKVPTFSELVKFDDIRIVKYFNDRGYERGKVGLSRALLPAISTGNIDIIEYILYNDQSLKKSLFNMLKFRGSVNTVKYFMNKYKFANKKVLFSYELKQFDTLRYMISLGYCTSKKIESVNGQITNPQIAKYSLDIGIKYGQDVILNNVWGVRVMKVFVENTSPSKDVMNKCIMCGYTELVKYLSDKGLFGSYRALLNAYNNGYIDTVEYVINNGKYTKRYLKKMARKRKNIDFLRYLNQ